MSVTALGSTLAWENDVGTARTLGKLSFSIYFNGWLATFTSIAFTICFTEFFRRAPVAKEDANGEGDCSSSRDNNIFLRWASNRPAALLKSNDVMSPRASAARNKPSLAAP